MAVALLSASMLLSSTGITSLAVNQSDVATTASSVQSSVSVSDDTANITKSGGSLNSGTPKMSVSGGTLITQAGYDNWPSGDGSQANPYAVSSLEDFLGIQTIINDPTRSDKYFRLTQDIDLSTITSSDLSTAIPAYSGISGVLISISKSAIASAGANASNIFFNIDGTNYDTNTNADNPYFGLKNFNPTNGTSQTVAIFGYINSGSSITNIDLKSSLVTTSYSNSLNSAVLAVQNEGTISGCIVDYCRVSLSAPSAVTDYKNVSGSPIYRGTAVMVGDNAGTIENCSIVDSKVEFAGNARYVGIVAGQNRGTIRNISLNSIKLKNSDTTSDTAKFIGGVTGSNTNATSVVTGCTVNLSGTDANSPTMNNIAYGDVVGGAVGKNNGSVVDTVVSSSLSIDSSITTSNFSMYGSHIFGGVVGENLASGSVTSCSALNIGAYIGNDDVTRTVFGFGGIVGRNTGSVTKCVATGKVVDSGSASTYMTAGGLVGHATSTTVGALTNSFAFVSLPQSHADIGALIGRGGSMELISNCYYDATVAGRSFPCESYRDAFSGDISSETKAIILSGTIKTVSKDDLRPALNEINMYIRPAFHFTSSTPAAYLESGASGITVTNNTGSVSLSSNTAGSADNLFVTASVTMAATVGSTAGIVFNYKFKVPVLYPSAHTDSDGSIFINDSTELNFIRYSPFSKFKLNANVTTSAAWTPFNFFGVLNGNGKTLTVNKPLFSRVLGSRTESLTDSNEAEWIASTDARTHGYIHDLSVILNSNLSNTAVFGSCTNITFTGVTFNRAASTEIIATKSEVGAFMNEIRGGAYIYNCFTNVPIRVSGSSLNYFGGFAARVAANDLIIDNCGSNSAILAETNYAPDILASFIGSYDSNSSYGKISNCYATGKVEPSERRCYIAIGQCSANVGTFSNNIWSISDTLQGAKEPISAQSHQTENFTLWMFSSNFGMVNTSAFSTFTISIPTANIFTGAVVSDFTITYDTAKLSGNPVSISEGSVSIPLIALVNNPTSQLVITHNNTGLVARLSIIKGLNEEDGYILINTAGDLLFLSSEYSDYSKGYYNSKFKVTANIDMSGYILQSFVVKNNDQLVPFTGEFVGTLGNNGERYTISNLTIVPNNNALNAPVGLFSLVTGTEAAPATFENLIFDNVSVSGNDDYVGVLAGRSLGSTKFSNISLNSATVTAGAGKDFAGGLLGGAIERATTTEFYGISISDLTISANDFVGGFAGFLNGQNTSSLQSLSASVIVDKIDLPDPQSDIINTLDNIEITADGYAGAVFGAVSDTSNNGSDSVLTNIVVNNNNNNRCDYNNISMKVSNVDLSDSSINTVNWSAGGLIGASNAAGYPDNYGLQGCSFGMDTWIKNCNVSDTSVTVTPPDTLEDSEYRNCSAGLVAGIYSGLVENVTVSDCNATGAYLGGLVGSKNFVYSAARLYSRSGLAINNCNVIGETTLTVPRTLGVSGQTVDPGGIAGGILGSACDWAESLNDDTFEEFKPYVAITNCGVGKDVTIYSNYVAGGICGELNGSSGTTAGLWTLIINNCTSFANITNSYGTGPDNKGNYFGGIAGIVSIDVDGDVGWGRFSISNCAVGGSIYSSASSTATKLMGGLVGYDAGSGFYDDYDDPLFDNCYIAVQLKNNSSNRSATVADGYVVGYSKNTNSRRSFKKFMSDGLILDGIKISSFGQSTQYIIGFGGGYSYTPTNNLPTVANLNSNSLCMDLNKKFSTTANTRSFDPDNPSSYTLDNGTPAEEIAYTFNFNNADRSYNGMGSDLIVFDTVGSNKINGWVSSNDHVSLTNATESHSGNNYTYTVNISANGVGSSEIYGEFVSGIEIPGTGGVLIPDTEPAEYTTPEHFKFKVGIAVTSAYVDNAFLSGGGTSDNPYQISNKSDLGILVCNHSTYSLDKCYILTNDITLSDGDELLPIGDNVHPFTGTFDGDGYTITGAGGDAITIGKITEAGDPSSSTYGLGLFGQTNRAIIENLNLKNFRVESYDYISDPVTYAGAVTAYATDTVFENITVSNTKVSKAFYCGGIVGHAEFTTATPGDSSIKSTSVINSTVSATSDSTNITGVAGGIVAEFKGVIGNSVLPNGKTEDILVEGCHINSNKSFVGGIVGRNIYVNGNTTGINITINNAAVRKAVSDTGNVYEIHGQSSNTKYRNAVGGIIGALYDTDSTGSSTDTCTINNSVVGDGVDIRNSTVAGGIIGYSYLKQGTVTINKCKSFANVESTALITSDGDKGAAAIVGLLNEFTVFRVKNSVAGGKVTFKGVGGGIFGAYLGSNPLTGLSEPVAYNCVVSANIVDGVSGAIAGLVLGEHYDGTVGDGAGSSFPESSYAVTPFLNIFFSGYQHPYNSGSAPNLSRSGAFNSHSYLSSIVRFIDMNSLKYSESDTVIPITSVGFDVATGFTFDSTGDLYSYLDTGYTPVAFRTKSTLNDVSDYHNFNLVNIRSRNNIVTYDASLGKVVAIGEGSEPMEFVYDNGIVISVTALAMGDLEFDTDENCYIIKRIAHLAVLKTFPDANFKQYCDLNFEAAELSDSAKAKVVEEGGVVETYNAFAEGKEFYNDGEFWIPVDFSGTYDGNHKTLSSLKIASTDNAGFFGTLSGTVKDLTLSGADISSSGTYVGVAAAVVETGAQINNVSVSNITASPLRGATYVGGIAGKAESDPAVSGGGSKAPSITNCSVSDCYIQNTTYSNSVAAGIVAYSAGAYISNCLVKTGTVIGNDTLSASCSNIASGIVGIAEMPSRSGDNDTDIEGCNVETGVTVMGKERATGILGGTNTAQTHSNNYSIKISNCTVGSGDPHESATNHTRIVAFNDTAAGIFSQPLGYTKRLRGATVTIRGCKVGNDVDVLAGLDGGYNTSTNTWSCTDIYATYYSTLGIGNRNGGFAGGIVGGLGTFGSRSTRNNYSVYIYECESYANVGGRFSAAAVIGQMEGLPPTFIHIEASAAGGRVYAYGTNGAACGFIGECPVDDFYDTYDGDGVIKDCIFSAELTSRVTNANNTRVGVISPLLGISERDLNEDDFDDPFVDTYDEMFKNIYYSSYQTNFYDGHQNFAGYDSSKAPVRAFANDSSYGGYLTLIDIARDEDVTVVMANNTPETGDDFSQIVFTKLTEGASFKRPLKVNIRKVESIVSTGRNDTEGFPEVTVTRSAQPTDIAVKANSLNLSNNNNQTLNLSLPMRVIGVDVDASGSAYFEVALNNITADTRHSAQITPIEEQVSKLIVEITGGLKLPIQLISADLEGSGTQSDPFLILSKDNLGTASRASGGFYWKQMTDIDLTTPPANFAPIGSAISPFSGGYDGNGYRITNLSFNLSGSNYVGLFGYVTGNAQLKNIHIELGSNGITGSSYVGGLVGRYSSTNKIINCSVVNSVVSGVTKVGGLAGEMTTGAQECFTSTQVKAENASDSGGTGGIAGTIVFQGDANSFVLDRCFTSGSVTAKQSCGALIGSAATRPYPPTLEITNCFSTADVFYIYGSGIAPADYYVTSLVGYLGFQDYNRVSIELTNTYFAGTNTRNRTLRLLPANFSITEYDEDLDEDVDRDSNTYTNVYYDRSVTGLIVDTYTPTGESTPIPGERNKASELPRNDDLPTGFGSTVWTISAGNYPALIMADAYSNIYSHIGAMALMPNDNEITPNSGFRYSVTIPSTIDGANVSLSSSTKGLSEEGGASYNSNYDTGLTGNTAAKTSDFLWKTTASGRIPLLRNVFGGSALNGEYTPSYEENAMLPYVTASYTKSCTFTELSYDEGDTPASTTVNVTASRKIVVPLENAANSYYIATERQLRAITETGMGTKMNRFQAINSSDNGALNYKVYIGYDIDLNSSENFTPIPMFRGVFDGGGNTISGLSIDGTGTDNVGFFAQIKGNTGKQAIDDNGTVRNLTLKTVGVTGRDYVGVLAGYVTDTVYISDCFVYAQDVNNVPGTVTGRVCVGGLVGAAANETNESGCKISRSGSYIGVTGNNRLGGLIGLSVLPIEECGATGNISATVTNQTCALYAPDDSNTPKGNIGMGVGGLVGTTTAGITKSYASGSVTVNSLNNTSNNVGIGGLAGVVHSGAAVSLVFSSGEVDVAAGNGEVISSNNSGTKFGVGGLIGISNSSVTSCYSGSLVKVEVNAGTSINAINKGVGGLIGVSSGLQDAYSSGSVRADSTLIGKNVACGRVIGKSMDGSSNGNLYYDTLKKDSNSVDITGIGGVSDTDSGVVGIKTYEFWGSGFNPTNLGIWSINDGAYPVLIDFFGPEVSPMIKNAVALSVVTVTFDERDVSAVENGIVTMAFKMPTALEITIDEGTEDEYSEYFSFTAEPIEEAGLARVISIGDNLYVPERTSNAAQDIKFSIYVTGQKQYGTRNVGLACPEMLGTQEKPYLVATKTDLKHVAMDNATFTATDSASHYKYWVTPISITNGVTTVQSGKVYYKFIGDIDMTNDTYHINNLSGVTYTFGGTTVTFAGFVIEGDDFSVNNLSTGTSFIDKVNQNSEIRNLMFDNVQISGLSNDDIALIKENSGTIDGLIVRTVDNGNIFGDEKVAGLVSNNTATGRIINSVADVTIACTTYGGGLVSTNYGTIERCAANVSITAGGNFFGGLVAQNNGRIVDSFSMGSITSNGEAKNQIGGFVGDNTGTIDSAYSTVSISGCAANTSGLFAGQNAAGATITTAYSSGFAGYANGASNLFCGSNAGTMTDICYDLSMAGSRTAGSNLDDSAATYDIFTLDCFSEEATLSDADHEHGLTMTAVGSEGTDANGYPQLTGLLATLDAADRDSDDNLTQLKFRVLQGYSQVSTAGIRTAYGQFINTLPVSTVQGVSVNKLTPGITWSSSNNDLYLREANNDVRARAAVNGTVTAATNVVVNVLRDSTITVRKVFNVSAGTQNPMFNGGDGSTASPYEISTATQFGNLKYYGSVSDASYKLTADINGSSLTPVPVFKGSLNGYEHVVYDYSSSANGLFGDIIGGTVENLGLVGASVNVTSAGGQNNFGMIAATLTDGGVLSNCYAIGNLTVDLEEVTEEEPEDPEEPEEDPVAIYINVGGLVGSVSVNSMIENCASSGKVINNCSNEACYISGTITKGTTTGGIAGTVDNGAAYDCMSTAFVSGNDEVGGIVGALINGSSLDTALFAGSAADSGLRTGVAVADGASVGDIVGYASEDTTVSGSIIDSQTVLLGDANADAKTTTDLINMTVWSTANGTSYPVPIIASNNASAKFSQGLSAVALPIFFEYKQADGSLFSYDTIKVPTTTSTNNAVTVATPASMTTGTAVTGYSVFVISSDPEGYTTAVAPAVTIDGVTNTVSRYIEPRLVRIMSLGYDVKTDSSASSINSSTVGVQIKNKYGALNMSSEAFTTAESTTNPTFDDIAVPIAQSGFYVGAKLPKGYEYQVKWVGYDHTQGAPASEDVVNEATVIENEYGCFVDASGWTNTNDVYLEITIVRSATRWGVFDSWDSLAS